MGIEATSLGVGGWEGDIMSARQKCSKEAFLRVEMGGDRLAKTCRGPRCREEADAKGDSAEDQQEEWAESERCCV